jgi:transcriptional regulator with XRE-family HTH domain
MTGQAPLLRWMIGRVLRRRRLAQSRTLREVAEAAGVSLPYLSEVERGRKEVSSEILACICRALGLSLIELLAEVQAELVRAAPRADATARRDPQMVSLLVGQLTRLVTGPPVSLTTAASVTAGGSAVGRSAHGINPCYSTMPHRMLAAPVG